MASETRIRQALWRWTYSADYLWSAGNFTQAGAVPANAIAAWNGATWSALGDGVGADDPNALVRAVREYAGSLIVGGSFAVAGGGSAANLARWDGAAWTCPGATDGAVCSLAVFDDKLIVGGLFAVVSGVPASNIAAWDGLSWAPLDVGTNHTVYKLATYNGELIAGGTFDRAGGLDADSIARWNGVQWAAVGGGVYYGCAATLAVYRNELIVGGQFARAGDVTALSIAAWDGARWERLGRGFDSRVFALTEYDHALIFGGTFTFAGDVRARGVARWSGRDWVPLGEGVTATTPPAGVQALTAYGSQLIAGGYFLAGPANEAQNIAAWDGASWQPLGTAALTNQIFVAP